MITITRRICLLVLLCSGLTVCINKGQISLSSIATYACDPTGFGSGSSGGSGDSGCGGSTASGSGTTSSSSGSTSGSTGSSSGTTTSSTSTPITIDFSQNYIISTTATQAVSDPSALTDNNSNTTTQYFDGLGRLSQTVQKAITPSGADLVSGVMYDSFGRDSLQWLPAVVTGNSGAFVSNYTSMASSSNGGDAKPYSRTDYEASPLDRVTGQYGSGGDWYNNGKEKTITYLTNGSDVKLFVANGTALTCSGTYAPGTLNGVQTTDEDGHTVIEFTDNIGQKILSRMAGSYDTYYVYDDFGNLRYVLPPLAADNINSTNDCRETTGTWLDLYGYIYHYDSRKRCIEKKLPGCAWIYMVYDLADRLILSQDGNQRLKKQWTVNKYDLFGRMLYSGLLYNSNSRSAMETVYSGSVTNENFTANGSYGGYSCTAPTPVRLLTVNYYDRYAFRPLQTAIDTTQLVYGTISGYDGYFANAKTLLTGTRIYHLDDSTKYEATALYYDKYGRVVQTRASNHLTGYDITYNALDFTGKPTAVYSTHGIKGASATYTELYTYTYDKAERLLTTLLSLNGGTPVTLAANTYDELGQLVKKMRHNNTEECDYTYNIRNWPTKMTSGSFVENLYYNTNLPSGATPCYNGNIAYSNWTYNGVTKGYQYTYDGLNRLTSATFKHETSTHTDGDYDETYTFDKMGNVTALTRKKDGSLIDNLDMSSYKGNQLRSVTDYAGSRYSYNIKEYQDLANLPDEFYYDANGNMRIDLDRNIATIRYNVLNLPEVIQFKNGNQIKNSYDAAGKKLGEEYFTQLTTLPVPIDTSAVRNVSYAASVIDQSGYAYVGNYEYNTSHGDATLTNLNRIYTDEGYIQNSKYYYFRRDHLSDNHEVWCADSSKVVQRTQYYPSGLPWAYNTGDNPGLQRKKYNNQAFIEMHGYDTYDIEWRQYYPGIMKFQTPDPEIEDYYAISPYTMCGDNMVIITDPNGRSIWSKLAKLVLKGGNTAASFASVCQDIKTIVNGEGSTLDQVTAVGSLASELLPVSLSDAKDGIQLVENVVQDAKAAKKAEQLAKNAAKGKEFEKASKSELIKNGHKEVVDQVTIKTSAGRTRMDHVSTKDGKIHLREDKSSRTAKLSRNQRKVHEALKKEGGIVVGNNGGQAYPSGTKIPPSEVEINRPK